LSDEERAAIERGLTDMRSGNFASEEAIAAIFRKARGAAK
jgi:predicted transcriptional regulator